MLGGELAVLQAPILDGLSLEGATAVVIRNGQLLTLRGIASGTGTSSEVVERLLPLARENIIGR